MPQNGRLKKIADSFKKEIQDIPVYYSVQIWHEHGGGLWQIVAQISRARDDV